MYRMRLLKQFLYGTFYLLILAGIGWVIYSVNLKPAPSCFDNRQNGSETGIDCGGNCVSCEIKNMQPLFLTPAIIFSVDRNFSAAAEIRNPNSGYGARFDYEVNFYDSAGQVLRTIKNKSFAYAGETKNIIEAGVKITEGIPSRSEIKIDASGIKWKKAQDFFQPNITLNEADFMDEKNQVSISGSLKNSNNFAVSKVILNAFLVDKLGVKIGVSKTELQNLDPFIAENFKISFPVNKLMSESIDSKATVASLSVEVLK